MIDLSYHVEFEQHSMLETRFEIVIGEGFTAKELISDEILSEQLLTLFPLTSPSAPKIENAQFEVTNKNQITISFLLENESKLWKVASLLNVIDSSTFIGNLDGEPYITKVKVVSPYQNLNLEKSYEYLSDYLNNTQNMLTSKYDIDIPSYYSDQLFNIEMKFSKTLSDEESQFLNNKFEQLDVLMASLAFEEEESADELFEDGRIPYPVEFTVSGDTGVYGIEFPPSNFSPVIALLAEHINKEYGITLQSIKLEHQEGW